VDILLETRRLPQWTKHQFQPLIGEMVVCYENIMIYRGGQNIETHQSQYT
jgi:hypothetical protein